MLVLIGVAPAGFVMNMDATGYDIARTRDAITHLDQYYRRHQAELSHVISAEPEVPANEDVKGAKIFHCDPARAQVAIASAQGMLTDLQSYDQLSVDQRSHMRRLLMCVADTAGKVAKLPETSETNKRFLTDLRKDLLATVEYAPMWIIVAVALALSLGTMVGWRRVATTIGEKIGKKGMTYAQGSRANDRRGLHRRGQLHRDAGLHHPCTLLCSHRHHAGRRRRRTGQNGEEHPAGLVLTLPMAIIISSLLYWLALTFVV